MAPPKPLPPSRPARASSRAVPCWGLGEPAGRRCRACGDDPLPGRQRPTALARVVWVVDGGGGAWYPCSTRAIVEWVGRPGLPRDLGGTDRPPGRADSPNTA